MTENKNQKLKRLIFPVGIFLLMFTIQSLIGITGVVSYFYFSGKKNLSDIESYTVNYSKTMAEAFARVAEFSYSTRKYSSLKTLFHEKIEENTIDEAFFVLHDGRLVVHSSTTTEKELMGNIASDEMTYNIDMILLPVQTKSTELILNNYNIINKTVPFKRDERDLLKKYIYTDINSTGWLFTKGVFHRGKPAGSINFIVSKDRIYNSIQESMDQAKYYSLFVVTVSMSISFFIALVVLFRYRSIQKNAFRVGRTAPGQVKTFDERLHHTVKGTIVPQDISEGAMLSLADGNFTDQATDYLSEASEGSTEDKNMPADIERKAAYGKAGTSHLKKFEPAADEDEYITVELLGEIEPGYEAAETASTDSGPREYIARVINLDEYRNSLNKEIKDAIPVRRKR